MTKPQRGRRPRQRVLIFGGFDISASTEGPNGVGLLDYLVLGDKVMGAAWHVDRVVACVEQIARDRRRKRHY